MFTANFAKLTDDGHYLVSDGRFSPTINAHFTVAAANGRPVDVSVHAYDEGTWHTVLLSSGPYADDPHQGSVTLFLTTEQLEALRAALSSVEV